MSKGEQKNTQQLRIPSAIIVFRKVICDLLTVLLQGHLLSLKPTLFPLKKTLGTIKIAVQYKYHEHL